MRLCLLGFAAGVLYLQQQAALPFVEGVYEFMLPLGLAAAVVSFASRAAPSPVRAILLLPGLAVAFAAGFCWAASAAQTRLDDALDPGWEGRNIQLVGVVDDLPQPGSEGNVQFVFQVERVETAGAAVPSRLSLGWYGSRGKRDSEPPPELHAGERWRIVVRLKRPHGNVNPHGFDIEAWLLESDLRATGYVRAGNGNVRLDEFAGRPNDWVQRTREKLRARILDVLEGLPYAGVIAALAIGDQRAIPQEQWLVFNRTGVGHLISISGLHVTLFATLVGALVLLLWRRSGRLTSRLPARKAAALAGALAAFVYVLLAGFQVPAQRTLYMLCVGAVGLWIGRPGTASLVLAWALAVVLVLDPWAVLAAGFWLSFGAVALLLFVGCGRLGEGHWLAAATRTQWAVTLGLLPLMLALFQQVSLVSPLANAFAIPVVSFVVVPLTLGGLIVPWDALLIGAHDVFAACARALEAIAKLPSGSWEQHAPPDWTVAAGVVGVMMLLAPRGVPGRLLGIGWLAPLFLLQPPLPPPSTVWLTVLDVGQGLAVVAQTATRSLLYDTGPRFNDQTDSGNRIIAPYLRAAGIRRLDGMIVSHKDLDHSGGARSLLQTVPLEWMASSLEPEDGLYDAFSGQRAIRCEAGQRWTWDGVEFAFLHPLAESFGNPRVKTNDRGCVLRIATPGGTVLIPGDIEARSERELLQRAAPELRADVLIVPHHGSKTSSTAEFIAAVRPQVAVVAAGYRNRFGHPKPEIMARYRDQGTPVARTDQQGALLIRFDSGGIVSAAGQRQLEKRYWRSAPNPDEASGTNERGCGRQVESRSGSRFWVGEDCNMAVTIAP
jgi:competence protein ComEC